MARVTSCLEAGLAPRSPGGPLPFRATDHCLPTACLPSPALVATYQGTRGICPFQMTPPPPVSLHLVTHTQELTGLTEPARFFLLILGIRDKEAVILSE